MSNPQYYEPTPDPEPTPASNSAPPASPSTGGDALVEATFNDDSVVSVSLDSDAGMADSGGTAPALFSRLFAVAPQFAADSGAEASPDATEQSGLLTVQINGFAEATSTTPNSAGKVTFGGDGGSHLEVAIGAVTQGDADGAFMGALLDDTFGMAAAEGGDDACKPCLIESEQLLCSVEEQVDSLLC